MRDYGKVTPRFWIGRTGKAIKAEGIEAVLVAMYLMTSPHADMLGVYYLPAIYISHDTGLTLEGALKGLNGCIKANFCDYDEALELVWVHKMAVFQVAQELKPTDNRVKSVSDAFLSLPECQHLQGFYDLYKEKFHLPEHPVLLGQKQAPSKPLLSQEQEQDQEQDQEITTVLPPTDKSDSQVSQQMSGMNWVEFFVNEKGFKIQEAQTATTVPMFVDWSNRGVTIPDVELAMITAHHKLGGVRPNNPTYYRNFVDSVMLEKQKIQPGHQNNSRGNYDNNNETRTVTGRKLSLAEQADRDIAELEQQQQRVERVIN